MTTGKYRDPVTGQFVTMLLGNGLSPDAADARYVPLVVPNATTPTQAANLRTVRHRERAYAVSANVSWNNCTAPGPWPDLMLGSQPDGPGQGVYYYLTNYVYGGTLNEDLPSNQTTRNVTQVAIPYTNNHTGIVTRNRYQGTWAPWYGGASDWIYPTFINGWVNYDTRSARYRKTTDGTVIWEGVVKNGTVGANICTVDVGYRPLRGNLDTVVSVSGGVCIFSLGVAGEAVLVNQQPATANPSAFAYVTAVYNVQV